MTHYRDLPEWDAVCTSVQNLLNATLVESGRQELVSEIVVSIFRVPVDQEAAKFIGGYSHFSTSPFPHIPRSIYLDADEYYSGLTVPNIEDYE